jgi:pimeloyl-ACP methyl ester carboxylesterase/alkylhydroperoxidase family enzyme
MKNPALVFPGALESLQSLTTTGIQDGALPVKTAGLIQLRVGVLAGWFDPAFIRPVGEARVSRETDERLHAVATWRDAPFFTEAERAALALTDAVTCIADRDDPVPDDVWNEAARHYDEKALASLVICIAAMANWPRLTVTTGQPAGEILTTEKVRSRDGTTITLQRRGSGPAVIMVDGAMCSLLYGPAVHLARELAANLTVYTYDRRGRGSSGDTAPYAVEREIEDLQAVIDAAGGNDVGVYGLSSGANLALEAAAAGATGLGKLALREPPLANAESELRPKLTELLAAGRTGDAVDLFQNSCPVLVEFRAQRGSPFRPVVEAMAPTLLYDLTLTADSSLERYRSITLPTLVLDTETDARLHNDALTTAGALPNARYRTIPVVPGLGRPVTAHLLNELTEFFTA